VYKFAFFKFRFFGGGEAAAMLPPLWMRPCY